MKVGHVWRVIFSLEGEESLKEMILELILGVMVEKWHGSQRQSLVPERILHFSNDP